MEENRISNRLLIKDGMETNKRKQVRHVIPRRYLGYRQIIR